MDEYSLTAVYYGLYGIGFDASMLAFLMTNMQLNLVSEDRL